QRSRREVQAAPRTSRNQIPRRKLRMPRQPPGTRPGSALRARASCGRCATLQVRGPADRRRRSRITLRSCLGRLSLAATHLADRRPYIGRLLASLLCLLTRARDQVVELGHIGSMDHFKDYHVAVADNHELRTRLQAEPLANLLRDHNLSL